MKLEYCEDNMLGNFTACIDCDDAVIQPNKLNQIIERMDHDITSYAEESGEYQHTKYELDKLKSFKKRELKKRKNHV
jgi:hypothetical protein